ncbi:MAG: hypothetical protein EP343_27035 [Deltaproteobacteria bacterium]|nr:MAG: hypothetical protein EP343_27035 [Deltaproteobacteria bacterium]
MKQRNKTVHPKRRGVSWLVLAGLSLLWLSLGTLQWGCGAQTSGTKIKYEVAFAGAVTSGTRTSFTNKKGWTIKLEQAEILVGPLYFYAGEPRASLWNKLFGINQAFAHVQVGTGQVLGEIQDQVAVNLLSEQPTSFGKVVGIEGQMRSFELQLHPPGTLPIQGGGTKALESSTVSIKGVATQGSETKNFQVSLLLPETGTMRVVENIATDVALQEATSSSGKLLVEMLVDKWFTNVDFATISKTTSEGVLLLDAENLALLQGVRSRYAYQAKWSQ